MFGLFGSPRCDLCGAVLRRNVYVWRIDGRDRRLCPGCSTRYERKASKAAFDAGEFYADKSQPQKYTALLFFGGLIVLFVVISVFSGGRSGIPLDAPIADTVKGLPSMSPAFFLEVKQSQQEAVRKYPQIGIASSTTNKAFLARMNEWKASGDPRMGKSDWPERVADDCANHPRLQAQPADFIGLTEVQLRQQLGSPIGVESHNSPDGPFKILKFDNTPGRETFFTIFADDGKVMQGYYQGLPANP